MSTIFKRQLKYISLILFTFSILGYGQIFTAQINMGKYISPGVAWGDYDEDGYEDIYISNGGIYQSTVYRWENYLFHNLGNGSFDSITVGNLVTDIYASGGCSWADYDNDGDLDMIVAEASNRQGGMPTTYYSKNSLYKNQGNGAFTSETLSPITDESASSGFGQGKSRIVPVWGDYNNDGWLDLFEMNSGFASSFTYEHSLYVSGQDYTFSEVTNTLTADKSGRSGASWIDFDNDGDIDLLTTSGKPGTETNLWVNVSGVFTKYTLMISGNPDGKTASGGSWGDYDNDGDFDLFIAVTRNENDEGWAVNKLFQNNTTTADVPLFSDMTSAQVGSWIADSCISYASSWGDYDNDGDLDLFIGNDGPIVDGYHNYLIRNNGNGTFTHIDDGDLNDYTFVRSCAWADYDNDGDLDLLGGREGPNVLFENNGNSNHWVNIKLIENRSNTSTSAFNSRVEIYAPTKQIREVTSQTGMGGQNSLRNHFGLGSATQVDSIVVRWINNSGTKGRTNTAYSFLPADKFIRYTYGDLNVTTDVLKNQNFMYLFGNTGAAVEFTANSDADGGTLQVQRFTSASSNNTFTGGSATAPGGSVTPNVVANDRYWDITETGLTGNFTVTVYVDFSGLAGVNDNDKLVIVKRANSSSAWEPVNTLRMGNTLYASGIISFSQITIGANSADNSLPVELLSFKAESSADQIILNWQTASEIENLGFIIERSDVNNGYVEIASYKTNPDLKGQGNSSSTTDYSFADSRVKNGATYSYRLSDISYSGQRTVLGIVDNLEYKSIKDFKLYPNYPNPFNPTTVISYTVGAICKSPVLVELIIFNALGQKVRMLVNEKQEQGSYRVIFDASGLSSGIYIYQLRVGKYSHTKKMLLIQ